MYCRNFRIVSETVILFPGQGKYSLRTLYPYKCIVVVVVAVVVEAAQTVLEDLWSLPPCPANRETSVKTESED